MKTKNHLLLTGLVVLAICSAPIYAQGKAKKKDAPQIVAQEGLPNVLIIGDSISMGYTKYVRENLAGKVNVYRTGNGRENNAGTTLSLSRIDEYLKAGPFDVIHFNWGLHDLKHVTENGTSKNSNSFDDPRQAEPDQYEKNVKKLVSKLKATKAKLIFATTTPYPEGVKPARLPADAVLYNEIALKIMKENDIAVNDLYSFVLPQLEKLQRPVNVHFGPEGSAAMGKQVAKAISKQLKSK